MAGKTYSVAVIGSTGGGMATLGHTDPPELLKIIHQELRKMEGTSSAATFWGVSRALFVALDGAKSFDNVDESIDQASLYQTLPSDDPKQQSAVLHCQLHKTGTLIEVNSVCKDANLELAKAIQNKEINGLICISCSVELFSETLQAAANAGIPVTGTGGTSLSLAAAKFRIRLVGNAGGSVANTSLTRAVSYAHALATGWNVAYRPWEKMGVETSSSEDAGPSFKSVINASLPAFWGVCLLKRFLTAVLPLALSFNTGGNLTIPETITYLLNILENFALPTACAVVMATSASASSQQDTSSLVMASVVASTVCWRSVLAGLLAGRMVSLYQRKVLYWCIVNNIPATMTNLVTTGGVGAVVALALLPVVPLLRQCTVLIRWAILQSVSSSIIPPTVSAFAWGCLLCYGSKVGLYHSAILPIILIEMECGDASFVGALDELTLVLVCAGVSFGNLVGAKLLPKKDVVSDTDLDLCKRAIYFNLLYGDFVEACYPFMGRHLLINLGGYLGSGLASSMLVSEKGAVLQAEDIPKSSAYLPWPITVWLASSSAWHRMLLASLIAFGIPCVFTIFNHALSRTKKS